MAIKKAKALSGELRAAGKTAQTISNLQPQYNTLQNPLQALHPDEEMFTWLADYCRRNNIPWRAQ